MKCKATWCFVIAALLGLAAPASAQKSSPTPTVPAGTAGGNIGGYVDLTVNGSYGGASPWQAVEVWLMGSTYVPLASSQPVTCGSNQAKAPSLWGLSPSVVCRKAAGGVNATQYASMKHTNSGHMGTWYGRIRGVYPSCNGLTGTEYLQCNNAIILSRMVWTKGAEITRSVTWSAPPPYCDPMDPNYDFGKCISPIVVPFDREHGGENNGVNVRMTPPVVPFDIDGDGTIELVAFPEPNSGGYLAIDLNGDGKIESGRELIGQNTGGQRYRSAFEAVAAVAPGFTDGTGDARILLWSDANLDGISQPEELQPATNVIHAVATGYELSGKKDQYGTEFRYKGFGSFTRQDDVRPVYDVFPAVVR